MLATQHIRLLSIEFSVDWNRSSLACLEQEQEHTVDEDIPVKITGVPELKAPSMHKRYRLDHNAVQLIGKLL